jgi:hypothetical protein
MVLAFSSATAPAPMGCRVLQILAQSDALPLLESGARYAIVFRVREGLTSHLRRSRIDAFASRQSVKVASPD